MYVGLLVGVGFNCPAIFVIHISVNHLVPWMMPHKFDITGMLFKEDINPLFQHQHSKW